MNVSYRWLQAIAPGLDLDPEGVADRLAMRGAPVEGCRALGEGLGDVLVGRVEAVHPHPNADRLTLCDVVSGAGAETVPVVCGAPNVRTGHLYPYVPPGGTLPDGTEIRRAKIRGVESLGMLCSERELGLGSDASGLMELDGGGEPGQRLVEALGLEDVLLEVEVTANRPDLLSHWGVGREVAPNGETGLRLPDVPGGDGALADGPELRTDPTEAAHEREQGAQGGMDPARIRIDEPDLCLRYLGAVVRGVRVGPSPDWLAARLRAVGARPVNNVVDATNYVLYELGQPLHAFDLGTLREGRIVVRKAADGEAIRTLDGEDRTLSGEMLAICDAERPVAVAGVIGGEETEVTSETTDLLLECALFEPTSIRSTRQALGLSTDSSYRFERGVDPEGMERALRRALAIILATAGGRVEGPVLDTCPRPFQAPEVPLRPGRVRQVLGVEMEPARVRSYLEPLGFQPREAAREAGDGEGTVPFRVPGHRSYDVSREIDLVEEVARVHGYDRFPEALERFRPGDLPDHGLFLLEDALRDRLVELGLLEARTPAFARAAQGEVELPNPVSREESHLRAALLPGLVERVERNFARGVRDVRLFEVGSTFRRPSGDQSGKEPERPPEDTRVAAVLSGRRNPPHWSTEDEALDLWDLKGLLEAVAAFAAAPEEGPHGLEGDGGPGQGDGAARAGGGGFRIRPGLPEEAWLVASGLSPAEAFTVEDADGRVLGMGGRLRDDSVEIPPWGDPVYGLEVKLPSQPAPLPHPVARPLPAYPAVGRDLAVLVSDELPAEEVLGVIRDRGGDRLEEVRVFDVYRGGQVPEGFRSVALRLRFRSPERTLTDAEVDERMDGVVKALTEELRVEIRGR